MTFCGSPLSRSLFDVKRTSLFAPHMSAFDPKRTSSTALQWLDGCFSSVLPSLLMRGQVNQFGTEKPDPQTGKIICKRGHFRFVLRSAPLISGAGSVGKPFPRPSRLSPLVAGNDKCIAFVELG